MKGDSLRFKTKLGHVEHDRSGVAVVKRALHWLTMDLDARVGSVIAGADMGTEDLASDETLGPVGRTWG